MKIGDILFAKNNLKCLTGSCIKDEPVQIIRIREENFCDVVNLRNELIFKIPLKMLKTEQ